MDIVLAFFFFALGIATDAVHNRIRRDSESRAYSSGYRQAQKEENIRITARTTTDTESPAYTVARRQPVPIPVPVPRLTLNPRKRVTSFLRIFGTICRRTDALLSTFADKEEKSWKVTSASTVIKRF